MTTETTAASTETTAVVTEQAAPVEQQSAAAVESTAPEQVEQSEPDYSYVPKKFLNDGKPDWENLSKSYQNLEKKLGAKGVLVPEDISEYEWSGEQPIPMDETTANAFKADAQKAGLSKEQYAFVMGKYEQLMTNSGFNPEASEAVLKKEWGDEFGSNLKLAKKAFDEFAPSDVTINDPILNHPTVLKILARMGQELGEDSQTKVKGTAGSGSGLTQEEISEIQKSPDYWNNPAKQKQVSQWYESRYK